MQLSFTKNAWEEYLYWQQNDKIIIKKINHLIKECLRNPFEGTGKPEPLKQNLSGLWSRRISGEHRFVYKIYDDYIQILQLRYHY
jgi:toxin YoeB